MFTLIGWCCKQTLQMPSTLFLIWLYLKSCVLQVGNCLSSYLPSISFMLLNFFFFLVTIPLRMIYLLFNLPLVPIRGIFQVGDLFSLVIVHFHSLCCLVTLFPSYLLPSVTYNPYIIRFTSIVFQVFHHFFKKLNLVGLAVQPHKCDVWFPLGLFLGFLPPSSFCTPVGGIKILDVPLKSLSFTSFLTNVLDDDVHHISLS